jgi:hypothetical protein
MPLLDQSHIDRLAPSQMRPRIAHASGGGSGRGEPQQELFRRAAVLNAQDQLLLELAFKNNVSVRTIGRTLNKPAGTISRRLQRLCARLRDPMVGALIDPACQLGPEFRQVAIEYFAQGQTIRELADLHQMAPQQVRAVLAFVRGWYRGIHLHGRGSIADRR